MDPLNDMLEETLEDALGERLAEALEDPDEMLAPVTEELKVRVLGTCDVDE